MKRMIKASSAFQADKFIDKLDQQIRAWLGNRLIVAEPAKGFGRGGYVYIFKINDHNVYRVFCDDVNQELIFQCVGYAFDVNGREYYDDARDYKDIKGKMTQWFGLIKQWVNECEADDPNYTTYEISER